MSRLDWKSGRFNEQFEVAQAELALRGYQGSQIGDQVEYLRLDSDRSTLDDLFDEGTEGGKVFHPSVTIPCLHVTHGEGPNQLGTEGFYFNDSLYVTTSFDMFARSGLIEADVRHDRYLKDRILYDGRLFRVTSIQLLGQVKRRDLIVSIEGAHIKPDELVDDPQFGGQTT